MIEAVAGINPNTVVCLVTGSMIMIEEWAKNIPAILYSWYAGMEGGTALARILFGDVNPSGKLPFSIPTHVEHLPYFSSTDKEITYDLYHGYTLLDKNGHQPAYPFGFGLSYTQFEYSDLSIDKKGIDWMCHSPSATRASAMVRKWYRCMWENRIQWWNAIRSC